MTLVFVYHNEIAKGVKICLLAAVEFLLVGQAVDHCLSRIEVFFGGDRNQWQFFDESQVRVLLPLIGKFHGLTFQM